MPKLPAITGDKVIDALEKVSFKVIVKKEVMYGCNMKMGGWSRSCAYW